MHKPQAQVGAFMMRFNQHLREKAGLPSTGVQVTRANLIREECNELYEAILNGDMEGIADGIVDVLYVAYGTANAYGLDIEPLFNHVHEKNMTKVWDKSQLDHMPENGVAHEIRDTGSFIVTLNGKVLKPPGFTPPNLKPLIESQS